MKKVTQEEKAHQSTDSALRWKQVRFQELAKRPLMKYILSVSRSLKEGTELKRYHGCWLEWNTKYTHSSFSLISGRLLTGHKNNMAQPKADKWLSSPGIKTPTADKWLSSPGIKTPTADKWLSSPGIKTPTADKWLSSPGTKTPRADKWLSSPGTKTPRTDKWLSYPSHFSLFFTI